MTSPSPEAHLLTGAYALDALDSRDRAEVEGHLAGCPTCAGEVAELRVVAGLLGQSVPETPPSTLRTSVLREAARTRQLPPLVVEVDDDLDARRERRRLRTITAVASAAAAVALVALGIVGGVSLDQHHQLSAERSRATDLTSAVAAAADRLGQPVAGGGTIAVIPFGNQAYVDVHDLPPLSGGRVYQLWMSSPQGVESAGVVGGNAQRAARVLSLRKGVDSVKMTIEPAGGSQQPTTPIIGSAAVHG
ncbi:anti-sigma factor [Pseudofrankia inefficax]|uniref:Regulator of SigK n=1 Tax=Pseudofrankia inefficax (strain DSM 45817 / CECT 9037 / DDB 130130 / EuI1c) TaxID=298654 RepID=E3JB31_PSEI1|nr:anti-sigma factor [Pseudofrankia inefficax]ADP84652.1 Anti-sigma K factor RskA [Pseudofrankia inefficax]